MPGRNIDLLEFRSEVDEDVLLSGLSNAQYSISFNGTSLKTCYMEMYACVCPFVYVPNTSAYKLLKAVYSVVEQSIYVTASNIALATNIIEYHVRLASSPARSLVKLPNAPQVAAPMIDLFKLCPAVHPWPFFYN